MSEIVPVESRTDLSMARKTAKQSVSSSSKEVVTLETIAHHSGVSRGAVSQVLRNPEHPRFSAPTRQRILEAARELNYRPNRTAQALRSGTNQLLSLVVPWNTPELLDNVELTAKRLKYNTMLQFTFDRDVEAEKEALFAAIERRVDGIIWLPGFPNHDYSEILEQLERNLIDVVFVDWGLSRISIPYGIIEVDYLAPFKAFFDQVCKRGFTEVVMLTRNRVFETWGKRFQDMKAYFAEYTLPVRYIHAEDHPQYLSERGTLMPEVILEQKDLSARPLVFSYDDWMGVRTLFAARSKGVSVPEEMGIMVMGDILLGNSYRLGELTSPTISGICRPAGLMGQTAVELLVSRIEGRSPRNQIERIILPASLQERESTQESALD